jgi:hypothetical protein
MLIRLIFAAALTLSNAGFGQDIQQLRNYYVQAGKNREKTNDFVAVFSKYNKILDPLQLAYYGTALAMNADIAKGKYTKYKLFVSGRDKIEEAVNKDKLNVEIRVLRFSVQSNLPAFLFYDNREEDKAYILNNLAVISNISDVEFVSSVWNTLLKSGLLTEQEKLQVQNQIKQMQKT